MHSRGNYLRISTDCRERLRGASLKPWFWEEVMAELRITLIALIAAAGLSLPAAAGDSARGAVLYKECAGCHAPQRLLMGPPHCGVIGRKAATIEGYSYSDTLREAGIVWDEPHLHEFLTFPIMYMPGTKMGFAGMFDENDRNDVIAFLKSERAPDSPACQPGADPAPPAGAATGELGATPAGSSGAQGSR